MNTLLDRRREVTGLVLAEACGLVIFLLEVEADDPKRGNDDEKDGAENPVEREQNHHSDDDGDAVGHQKHEAER